MSLLKQKIESIIMFSLMIAGVIFSIISIVQIISGNYGDAIMSLRIGVMCLLIPILYSKIF